MKPKKHMPGFVPINFNNTGKALLAIGLICLALKIISFLFSGFSIPDYIFYLGAGLIIISLYLIFVVPKE